jgi:hypothetical protein
MKRHLLLLATLALPALAAAGPATSFADAAKRHRSGDTAAAMAFWVPLAQQGDANAAFNLGTIHQYGDGVAKNPAEALKWYRIAAERGDREAQSQRTPCQTVDTPSAMTNSAAPLSSQPRVRRRACRRGRRPRASRAGCRRRRPASAGRLRHRWRGRRLDRHGHGHRAGHQAVDRAADDRAGTRAACEVASMNWRRSQAIGAKPSELRHRRDAEEVEAEQDDEQRRRRSAAALQLAEGRPVCTRTVPSSAATRPIRA